MSQAAVSSAKPVAKTKLWPQLKASVGMTKPTVSLLVVVTVIPGLLLAAQGSWPEPVVVLASLLGTYLASASAAIFNHLIEVDSDARMERTKARPILTGDVSKPVALMVAITLAVISLATLAMGASVAAAVVALAANVFYVVGYTLILKRRTPQNIVIGGAAGAVGPLIGWAAVAGDLGAPAWALFALIFMWTPPHFWALSLKYKEDYAKARIPMMPVVRGEEHTRWLILLYALLLLPTIALVNWYCAVSAPFAALSLAMTAVFAWRAFQLYRRHNNELAMPVFHYSCFYLFVLFSGLTIDKLWQLI